MRSIYRILFIAFCVFLGIHIVDAQNCSSYVQQGDAAFAAMNYARAIECYSNAQACGDVGDYVKDMVRKSKMCDQLVQQLRYCSDQEKYYVWQQLYELNPTDANLQNIFVFF